MLYKKDSFLNTPNRLLKCFRRHNHHWIKFSLGHGMTTHQLPAKTIFNHHPELINQFPAKDAAVISALAAHDAVPLIEKNQFKKTTLIYLLLLVCLNTTLIASNVLTAKIIHIFGLNIVAGTLYFPLTYSITEVITEVYGFDAFIKGLSVCVFGNVLVMLFIKIAILLPPAKPYLHQAAFKTIFDLSIRGFIASMIAFSFGDLITGYALVSLKEKLLKDYLTLRLIIAATIGFFVDTVIFVFLTQTYHLSIAALLDLCFMILMHKCVYGLVTCKFVAMAIERIKRYEKDHDEAHLQLRYV